MPSPKPNSDTLAHISAEPGRSLDSSTAEDVEPRSPKTNLELIESATDEVTRVLGDFLSGRREHADVIRSVNKSLRSVVVEKLVMAMSDNTSDSEEQQDLSVRQERARQLFVDHGYIEDVMHELRTSDVPETRAQAARTLGLVRSQLSTASLIAALFDDAPEVCNAAATALSQIGDPAVSIGPLSSILGRPLKMPHREVNEVEPELTVAPDGVNHSTNLGSTAIAAAPETNDEQIEGALQTEEEKLFQEQETLRSQLVDLEAQLRVAVIARHEAEKEVRFKTEQESRFRAEAAARRHEEEEARKRAEEKAARRRYEDERKLATDQLARLHAEEEAHHRVQEDARLRLQVQSLKESAAEVARLLDAEIKRREVLEAVQREDVELQRRESLQHHAAELARLRVEEESLQREIEASRLRLAEVEAAQRQLDVDTHALLVEKVRLDAAQASIKAEAERIRETELRASADQERLAQRTEALRQISEDMAARLAAVETAKQNAEAEDRHLVELETRTKAAEERRREMQAERMLLESQMRDSLATEQHLLEEIRFRAQEQEKQLAETARARMEEQTSRLEEMEAFRARLEAAVAERAEQESEIVGQTEELRRSEAEMINRIEGAEVARRSMEDKLRRTTELVQRAEADARARAIEDDRALAKLDEVRRKLHIEVQVRAEQEDRIRKEIEVLKTREIEQRSRVEQEIRHRAEAELRLQEEKSRLKSAEEARLKTELAVELLAKPLQVSAAESGRHDPTENLRRVEPPATQRLTMAFRAEASRFAEQQHPQLPVPATASLPSGLVVRLNHNDPEVRAAAIASLPSAGDLNAFEVLVNYFDDPAPQVRNAVARALRELEPLRPVESFTRALEGASAERRRNIGDAIAASGIAGEALSSLDSDSREDTYNALCLLFVMAKTGEVQPLVHAIETHKDVEVRRAAIKLLNLSGQSELADAAAKRRLGHDPA